MKTNYQLTKNAFGVITFVLSAVSMFNNSLIIGLILLCGYALILEKDQWMSKQALQGLFLSFACAVIIQFLSMFNININLGLAHFSIIFVILIVIRIIVGIFAIIGIFRTAKGLDADLPFFTVLANKALGIVIPANPPENKTENPVSYTSNNNSQNTDAVSNQWLCSCGRINQGRFCSICGKEKE